MKQRFTTFDLVAVVAELQKTIVGQRLQNIYDIDGKTYLLKFASGENKHLLYIQSGTRIHLTDYDWAKNAMPGGFSMKLRKHVRQKRLESVAQLGIDRIVDMQFGTNELAFHLIIELYDRGNLVLTDHTYKILIVLRKRVDETSDSHFEQDAHYPIDAVRKHDPTLFATEHLRTRCVQYLATCDAPHGEREAEQEAQAKGKKSEADKKPAKGGGGAKKNAQRVRNRTTLSSVLNALFPFGTQLVAHALHTNGLRDAPVETYLEDNGLFSRVTAAMSDAQRVFEETRCGAHSEGIVVKRRRVAPPDSLDTTSEEMNYEEYHPILFAQLAAADEQTQFDRFDSFNAAVDDYYTHAEKLRSAQRAAEKRTAAARRLENVRRDHELRVQQLDADVRACRLKARTIERNADLVDKTIRIVNSLVAQQLGWEAIDEQVEAARRRDDPVATRIDRLLLDRNQVALRFPYEPETETETENDANAAVDSTQVHPESNDAPAKAVTGTVDKGKRKRAGAASRQADTDPSVLVVEVDLGMSAYANVERYYELQKRAAEKAKRTLAASSDALRNAQRSYAAELAAAQRDVRILQRAAASAMASKRTLWFEKFRWFVSSDCYLVLAGATQSQNETLVKHYLRTRDIYVHADLHGAASVVIKNPRGGPLPPRTLEEAGDFALCNSAAWDSRLVSNAWWVYAEQVSKTPPTGMYVSAGSFIIRGRKNYLRPTSLLFGFAFLFRLAPESAQRRKQLAPADHDQLGEMPGDVRRTESVTYDDADEEDDESEAASRLAQLTVETSLTDDDKHSQIAPKPASLQQERSDSLSQPPDDAGESSSAAEQNKRIISRAERRRLKKDRDGTRVSRISESETPRADDNADDSDGDDENDDGKSTASVPTKGSTPQTQAQNVKAAQNAPVKRGQRAKLKKIKERYADQDDEERTLRMNILKGVGTARSEKKQKEREEHEQRSRVAKEKAERAKQKREAKEKQAQSARGRPVEDQDREKGANDEDFDDAPSESDEEQQRPDQLTELLLSLTGNLLSDDVALQAVPVCAPYAALNRYKFKVKLQPGTTKRSKAVKFALDVFLQDKNATDIEKALIKAVVEQDLSRNFPGKVKVSAPNLLRLHTNAKAKSSAKQKHAAAN